MTRQGRAGWDTPCWADLDLNPSQNKNDNDNDNEQKSGLRRNAQTHAPEPR